MSHTIADAVSEIESGENGSKIAAFFDFDGTLIHGYSALVFAQDRIMRRQVGAAEAVRTARLGVDYALGRAGYDELIKLAGSTWKGMAPADVEQLGQRLFREHISDRVYPEARALVAAHRKMGHTIAITTSATWFQVAPIAKALGIDHVVCQHLEVIDNVVTGAMAGASMWGPGKAAAARRFADEHDINFHESFFYADGDEDAALMNEIGKPRPTNPGKHLAAVAAEHGWPVLQFEPRGTPSIDVMLRNMTGMLAAAPVATGAALLGLVRKSRREASNLTTSLIPSLMLGLANVELEVVNSQALDAQRPAVFVVHQRSRIDTFVIAKLLGRDTTIVVDRSLASDPVVGTIGRLLDVQFVRGVDELDARRMASLGELLSAGTSVAFAVGSVDDPGRLDALRVAPLRLAYNASVPIVAVAIRDSEQLVTRRPPVVRPGTIHIDVTNPQRVTTSEREALEAQAARITAAFGTR